MSPSIVPVVRTIVLRLVDGPSEGNWVAVPGGNTDYQLPISPPQPWKPADDNPTGRVSSIVVRLVPTGDVEWDGDRCAEVWVPEQKLDLWLAEHRLT